MKKLIIFDCDGVLVNSEIIANRIEAEALTVLGFAMTTEEHVRLFIGADEITANEIMVAKLGKLPAKAVLEQTKVAMYQAIARELTALITPVLQLVLKHNIAHCVASNSNRDWILKCLQITQQIDFFSAKNIFSLEQVTKRKPAPDIFLLAAKTMGFELRDCLVIEDSMKGIQAAQAANIEVIGFLGGDHAKYDWYQQSIKAFNIPIAYDAAELLAMVEQRCV